MLEYDGYSHGVDIAIYGGLPDFPGDKRPVSVHLLPIAIQCKCTARAADLELGFEQAHKGFPDAKLWACIHSFQPNPHKRTRNITVVYRFKDQNPFRTTLPAFLNLVRVFCTGS